MGVAVCEWYAESGSRSTVRKSVESQRKRVQNKEKKIEKKERAKKVKAKSGCQISVCGQQVNIGWCVCIWLCVDNSGDKPFKQGGLTSERKKLDIIEKGIKQN